MAIPAIKPYPMPDESELPVNKVAWTADPKRAVLLIHDMQQYFLDPFTAGESPVVELIANIRLLHERCSELGIPIVYTAQPGGQTPEQRALLQDFWGPGINDGPYQKQIVSELTPASDDIVLTKWRYSAFRKTNLSDILQEKGRDQLLLCGVYAHIGCLLTACDAFMLDVQPFFVADAVADFSLDNHKMALKYAAERCAVTLATQSLLGQLGHSAANANVSVPASGVLTERLVREQVAELLQEAPSTIGESDNLIDRGLDSVRLMSLVERWRRFGAEVAFVELAEHPTLKDWWRLLSLRQQPVLPNADYFAH